MQEAKERQQEAAKQAEAEAGSKVNILDIQVEDNINFDDI
jgi:hypothetical protein